MIEWSRSIRSISLEIDRWSLIERSKILFDHFNFWSFISRIESIKIFSIDREFFDRMIDDQKAINFEKIVIDRKFSIDLINLIEIYEIMIEKITIMIFDEPWNIESNIITTIWFIDVYMSEPSKALVVDCRLYDNEDARHFQLLLLFFYIRFSFVKVIHMNSWNFSFSRILCINLWWCIF